MGVIVGFVVGYLLGTQVGASGLDELRKFASEMATSPDGMKNMLSNVTSLFGQVSRRSAG